MLAISSKRTRLLLLVLTTAIGVAAGLAGDLDGPGSVTTGDMMTAVVLSPIVATFGGGAASYGGMRGLFIIGGFLFWPVYLVLAWSWIRRGCWWIMLVVPFWVAQGFFRLVHRMWLIMSA